MNPELVDHGSFCKYKLESTFGDYVVLDYNVFSSVIMDIGDWVHIAPQVAIIGGRTSKLVMGHFSGISAGGKVICGGDDFASGSLMNPQVPSKYRISNITTVTFEPFSCIGVNSVVMPGITLGEGAVVGSNSTLTKDAEPWTIYVGSPARPIKKRPNELAYKYARELGYDF